MLGVKRHRIMSLCWKIRSKIKHLIHKPLPKPSERARKKSFFTLKMPEKGKIKPSKRFYPFLPRFNFFLSVTAFQTFLRRFKGVDEIRLTGEVFWGYSINYGTRKEHHSSDEKHQLPPIWSPVLGCPMTPFLCANNTLAQSNIISTIHVRFAFIPYSLLFVYYLFLFER